jgi:hypothetical protein
MNVTVPTLASASAALPGLDRRIGPHAPLLTFQIPSGQQVLRETNPRVYSILLMVHAKLRQIAANLNYLGYSDDYIPPWRFHYLLERSRYFAEHAKNAQRDYLNFLSNAENEELQEMRRAQNVELEKANIQIETARVDQAAKEVAASRGEREGSGAERQQCSNRGLMTIKCFPTMRIPCLTPNCYHSALTTPSSSLTDMAAQP